MKKSIKCLALASVLIFAAPLSACNGTESNSSQTQVTSKATVISQVNSHGIVNLQNVDEDNTAAVNTEIIVEVLPDIGYRLEMLKVNNVDITATRRFTVTQPIIYNVTAYIVRAVAPGLTAVVINGPGRVEVGKEIKLEGEVFGPYGDIAWSSSDEKIATVDENGKVKGIKPGFATITATAKDRDNQGISTSHFVFVEPDYIEKMISFYETGTFDTGVKFTLPISMSLNGMPITINSEMKVKSYVENNQMNFNMSGSTSLSILGMMGADIDYQYLKGMDNPLYTISKTIDEVKTPLQIGKMDLNVSIFSLLENLVPSLLSLMGESTTTSEQLDNSQIVNLLSSMLIISEDPSEGICLSPMALTLVNQYYQEIDWTALAGDMGGLLTLFLPESITDIRYTVTLDENGGYKTMSLTADGLKGDTTSEFLNASLDMVSEEFTDEDITNELNSISSYVAAEAAAKDYLDKVDFVDKLSLALGDEDKNNSLYIEKVAELWKTYEALNHDAKGLVTGMDKDFFSLLSISSLDNKASYYYPWLVLTMTDQNSNVINEQSKVNAGDVITLNTELLGYYKTEELDLSYEITLSDKSLNAEDYLTFDPTNKTITIKKVSDAGNLTVDIKIPNAKTSSGLTVSGVLASFII